jgi:nitrite reductase (NADH) large subunit
MKRYLIIGNSAAGLAAVEAIRKIDKRSEITVVSDEDYPSYCRCLISYYLAGDVKEKNIIYRPDDFYKTNSIRLLVNKKVTKVGSKRCEAYFDDLGQPRRLTKGCIGFDSLLIATGASPKFPPIKGIRTKGVFGFRTITDAKAIEACLPKTKRAVVLGGGLIGLKAAYAISKIGIKVSVIIKSKQVLSQVLDFDGAGYVQKRLEEHGIEILTGMDIAEIIGGDAVKGVRLDDGKTIDTGLVLACKGVSPNIGLVEGADIKTAEGIMADNHLATNVRNVYAAGDVCETLDMALGAPSVNALWPVAVEQGKVAGANMAGEAVKYDGSVGMNSLEFFGLPTVSLGIYKVESGKGLEEIKASNPGSSIYRKVVLRGNHLVGAVLVGDIRQSGLFLKLIRGKIDVSLFKDKLMESSFNYPDLIDIVKDKEKMYV